MERWRKRVWVNWTSSPSPLSNANVGSPRRRISWQQIRIRNPWFWKFWMDWKLPLVILMKIPKSVVSPVLFKWKLVPLENVLWSPPAQGTMAWYAFECKARQAAQVMRNRLLALRRSLFVLYITQALQGRIGHGNETEENSGARLCAKLKSHTHTRTHTLTRFYQSSLDHRLVWFPSSFFPLYLLRTLDTTSQLISADSIGKCRQHVDYIILT